MKKINWKESLWAIGFLLAAALVTQLIVTAFRPPQKLYGSTWDSFLSEPSNSIDVLYLGSSMAYCDWNPGIIYDVSGLTGYVMAGSEQTPSITYWYLKEAFRTQSPSAVVMEGTSLFFNQYQGFSQVNIVNMPWGLNRLGAIYHAAEPELRNGLLFEPIFYHDRWKQMDEKDFELAFTPARADEKKGFTPAYVMETGIKDEPEYQEVLQKEEDYQLHLDLVAEMAALCEKEGAQLIITINPLHGPYSDEVYEKLERDLAERAPGVIFRNWSNSWEECGGLRPSKHLFDGVHLNWAGAELFSEFTGKFLLELGITPREQLPSVRTDWEETAQYWRDYTNPPPMPASELEKLNK